MKETLQFNGRIVILYESFTFYLALIKGWIADHLGNVIYRHNAQNLNPVAGAGRGGRVGGGVVGGLCFDVIGDVVGV
ncbi:CoA-transferase, partial [Pseudomonas syringae group genomosp. 7]|uniref:CoA-transferase n=1 Tax=Pseudomonas syringae group genomosp. 7 TaxID=251699 RepID=UPI00376F87B7